MLNFLSRHWFVVSLLCAILLSAAFFEEIAVADPTGSIRAAIRDIVVVSIFGIIGMTIPSEEIVSRLLRPGLYLFVQGFVFFVFPLVVYLLVLLLGTRLSPPLVAGLYALAVLPTTGSSCVVFTQTAGGNVLAATANAAVSNVAGLVLSPLLLSLLLNAGTGDFPFSRMAETLGGLTLRMILPLTVGQLSRRFVYERFRHREVQLRSLTSVLIVVVVFLSTSTAIKNAAESGAVFSQGLGYAVALLLLLQPLLMLSAGLLGRCARFDWEDRIAILFTASQKTLALGAPLLAIYFQDDPILLAGALFPLLLYHAWQLIFGGIVAALLGRRRRRDAGTPVHP